MLYFFSQYRLFFVIGALVLLLCGASAAYYYTYVHVPEGAESFRSTYNFTLKNYAGDDVDLANYKRKLLVVHVWASWCPYCGDELENLALLKREFGESIHILAVNRAEPLEDAKAYSDKLAASGIEFILDPEDSVYKDIEGYAMPETIFIGVNGEIVFHQRGPMKMEEVQERIRELLTQS